MQQQMAGNRMAAPPVMDYQAFYAYLVTHGLVAPPRQAPVPEESEDTKAPKKEKPKQVEVYRGDKKEVKELQK